MQGRGLDIASEANSICLQKGHPEKETKGFLMTAQTQSPTRTENKVSSVRVYIKKDQKV